MAILGTVAVFKATIVESIAIGKATVIETAVIAKVVATRVRRGERAIFRPHEKKLTCPAFQCPTRPGLQCSTGTTPPDRFDPSQP